MKGSDAAGGIDGDGRLQALRRSKDWLKDIVTKIMGWKQGAAITDHVQELNEWLQKFREARDALASDHKALLDMATDQSKAERQAYRANRHQETKIEKREEGGYSCVKERWKENGIRRRKEGRRILLGEGRKKRPSLRCR